MAPAPISTLSTIPTLPPMTTPSPTVTEPARVEDAVIADDAAVQDGHARVERGAGPDPCSLADVDVAHQACALADGGARADGAGRADAGAGGDLGRGVHGRRAVDARLGRGRAGGEDVEGLDHRQVRIGNNEERPRAVEGALLQLGVEGG